MRVSLSCWHGFRDGLGSSNVARELNEYSVVFQRRNPDMVCMEQLAL